MNLFVNGVKTQCHEVSLEKFLEELNLPEDGWAMALNGEFLPSREHKGVKLCEHDEIDIVQAHCGG